MAPIAARAFTGGSRACRQMSGGPSPGLRASTAVSTESSASMKSIRTPSTCRKMTTVATAGTSDAIPQSTPATCAEQGETKTSPAPGVSDRTATATTTTQKLVT